MALHLIFLIMLTTLARQEHQGKVVLLDLLDHQGLLDKLGELDQVDLAGRQEQQDLVDHQVKPEEQVLLDQVEHQELVDHQEPLDHQDLRDKLVLLDPLVVLDPLDKPVLLVLQVVQVHLGRLVLLDLADPRVKQEERVLLVVLVPLDKLVLQVVLDRLVVREVQDHQVNQEQQDHLVVLAKPAEQDPQEVLALLELEQFQEQLVM